MQGLLKLIWGWKFGKKKVEGLLGASYLSLLLLVQKMPTITVSLWKDHRTCTLSYFAMSGFGAALYCLVLYGPYSTLPIAPHFDFLQIHKDGTKVREHIAAEAAPKAIANVWTLTWGSVSQKFPYMESTHRPLDSLLFSFQSSDTSATTFIRSWMYSHSRYKLRNTAACRYGQWFKII